jgi:hypothetical protein
MERNAQIKTRLRTKVLERLVLHVLLLLAITTALCCTAGVFDFKQFSAQDLSPIILFTDDAGNDQAQENFVSKIGIVLDGPGLVKEIAVTYNIKTDVTTLDSCWNPAFRHNLTNAPPTWI